MKPTDQNNSSGKGDTKVEKSDKAGTPTPASQPVLSAEPGVTPVAQAEPDAKGGIHSGTPPPVEPVTPPPASAAKGSTTSAAGQSSTAAPSPGSTVKPKSDTGSTPAGGKSPAGTPPGGKPPTPPATPSGPSRGLSGLALLVALAALGLSGWQWYQADQRQASEASLTEQLSQLQFAQQQNQQRVDERLEGLPSASEWQQIERLSADLQRSQQAVSQRLDTLQGDAQSDWKLAEAEYLLRLASLRLLASQDITSARELLAAVDTILQNQPDSGVFAVREQLAQFQAELSALPVIDRSGVFLRLAAMREQVKRLVALPVPVFDPDEVSVEEEYEDRLARRTRAERVLMRLERYVRVDFQRGKVITPLLDEAELQRVQRTLQLAMEQAQWAALRGESDVYKTSLEQADGMLRQYFEMENPQVRAMQGQLENLAEQEVSLSPPDLSPLQQGLAAYIQSRRSPATADGEAAE
ncbi:uroporphyrinogen-III C-methyltransferase [Halopseudomonas pelagia]|uniref:uroporphyrinogen-III C-methyltransferase n=1 Tax=Halopseudomonas pelagia TaxID=553151 RepID=UPI0003B5B32E|nr:uroporphyrinogen-III C-methyltransferase [Halopseudomonas pelagia]